MIKELLIWSTRVSIPVPHPCQGCTLPLRQCPTSTVNTTSLEHIVVLLDINIMLA